MTETKHRTHGAVSAGQRRHVSLLFSDICDYTLLSEQVDPEEADEFRDRVEALAASIVRKHGGQITQVYGDGVLSVFGLPEAGEDDVRRAVNAALELHEAVRNASWTGLPANFEARLHSGVHAGLVFVRQGDALHGRYHIAGDTANTAARLCAVAPRDEVWVSDAALSGSEMFFESELVPQVTLKGKSLPMSLYRVNGRSDVRTRFEATARRGLTAFVDRVDEMGALLSSVRESISGRGSLMVITGAAGIGKTRLLAEFTARATKLGATVLRGTCDSYGELAPLEPFTQVLRQVFGAPASMQPSDATPLVEQVCARLGENVHRQLAVYLQLLALSPGDRTSLGAPAVTQALSTLIDTLAASQAIALILDDWQWADDASRTVLGQLHAIVKRRGGCIVVGMRMTELSDPTLQPDRLLGLQPLGDTDGIRVITSLRPQAIAFGVTQTLLQRAGGNPLFLEELCRSLSDDSLDGRQALVSTDIPQTVQGVIQARVSALPARMASLLRTAAVIGIEFSKALLDHVFDGERNDAAFDALISSDLIYRGTDRGIYRFKHGLTREVVYESVLMSERRRIHAAVASAIEQGVHANPSTHTSEALAYHYRGSGDFERAAHHATLAGDRAMIASALDRARYHYLAALNALERLPMTLEVKRRWLSISAKWALPFVFSPARDQLLILHTANAYATELSDYAAKAACGHWLGWAHYTLGDYTQSIEHYQHALDLAQQQGDRRLVAQLFSVLGQSQAASGSYVTAIGNLEHGLALKKNHALNQTGRSRGFPQGYAYALGCKALLHADRGEFELSDQEFDNALGVVTGNDHAIEGSVLGLRCMALLWRGRFQQALEVAVRNREIAQHVNSAFSFAMSSTFEAYATWRIEGSAEHALRMRSMIDWLQTQQLELFASFNYARLAQVLCAIGDFEGSRLYVDRALARARKGDVLGEAAAYTVLARLSMDGKAPSPAIAHDYLARAREAANARAARHELASVDLLAAELHWIAGERELAQKSAEAAQTEMLALGMEWHVARASDLLARLSSNR